MGKGQHGADSGGEIGGIRLKAAAFQRLLEGLSRGKAGINGVRLVAVGDDQVVFILPHSRVDDQAGIFNPGRVKGLGVDRIVFQGEHPVSGVGAASHDEVGGNGLPAVGALAHHNASAHIGVVLDQLRNVVDVVNTHVGSPYLLFLMSLDTISTAWGRMIHSACSMTRFCRVSGVSSGWTQTAFWRRISPPSGISLTKCTVAPVTFTP